MARTKVFIKFDDENEMLSIKYKGNSLFFGKMDEFDRDDSTFQQLFEDLGFEVSVSNETYTDENQNYWGD